MELINPTAPDSAFFPVTADQTEYLAGVLFCDDSAFKRATMPEMEHVDPFGHGHPAFWRGIVETQHALHFNAETGRGPLLSLRGASYSLLAKFHRFLLDRVPDWDQSGRLREMCSRNAYVISGEAAQQAVDVLYHDAWTARKGARETAEAVMRWRR